MKLSTFMAIVAVVAGLFGLGFVLIPDQVLSYYGVAPDAGINYMAQVWSTVIIYLLAALGFWYFRFIKPAA